MAPSLSLLPYSSLHAPQALHTKLISGQNRVYTRSMRVVCNPQKCDLYSVATCLYRIHVSTVT